MKVGLMKKRVRKFQIEVVNGYVGEEVYRQQED